MAFGLPCLWGEGVAQLVIQSKCSLESVMCRHSSSSSSTESSSASAAAFPATEQAAKVAAEVDIKIIEQELSSRQMVLSKSNSLRKPANVFRPKCLSDAGRNYSVHETKSSTSDDSGASSFIVCGISSDRGQRKSMEDFYSVVQDFGPTLSNVSKKQLDKSSSVFYFGLFDGHSGTRTAQVCKDRLHGEIAVRFTVAEDFSEALKEGFCTLDDSIIQEVAPDQSGCTAVAVFVTNRHIYIANSGDSRVVLSQAGSAINLTTDHKPELADEKKRIESSGGHVEFQLLGGLLGVSRAFGGYDLETQSKLAGLTARPDVRKHMITDEDEFIIVACDGLWDVISSEDAIRIVRDNLKRTNDYNEAAEILLQTALKRQSEDNVTVSVIGFKRIIKSVGTCVAPKKDTADSSIGANSSEHEFSSSSQRPRFNFSGLSKALKESTAS
eukprot:TRINITY_DN1099_c0_g1_i1.p1 TRINITY_DN1099_c0_g1~~TRINITY_DN1099_c0_g1_i1.p1  ORF type:complete len:440 (-),score=95.21 TRINITY_DN1099_c0_g1_i1:37-1356(-)